MRLVNLTKRVMVNGGLRYCPVIEAANGRIRPDVVMVDGTEERHPEGSYYIDYREGEKRVRISVGKNAADAQSARLAKQAELNAVKAGLEILDAPVMIGGQAKHSLAAAIASYLEDVKLSKKPKTYSAYSTALNYFAESCRKQFVEDIDRKDMLRFSAFLRDEKDQSPRSVYNKFESMMAFLKLQGVRGLVGKTDWPRFTEESPEVYEREEISKFLYACEPNERLWFEFFLMTGMREQEVMYTYWSDINFAKCTVKVSHKPDRDWTPKAYKEREIPVPESLIASLKRLKTGHGNCNLVFATSGCKPKKDFLDCCKAIAKRAKLNPETFWLHKFRATFATWTLWKQVDLRTVQSYLGHSDIESTMRYLKPAGHDHVREKMNSVFEGVSQ
jgi:integrase/recombinase XerD